MTVVMVRGKALEPNVTECLGDKEIWVVSESRGMGINSPTQWGLYGKVIQETIESGKSVLLAPRGIGSHCQQVTPRAYSVVGLLWHGWAWQTCATSTTLSCKPNASYCCPTKAIWFIRDMLFFARAPSNIRHFVLTAICNENRELSHTTPEATTRTPEAATLATRLLPGIWESRVG